MKKRILITPLNWGLGHATRCIPIIKALIETNYTPVIASDGIALDLLKIEFPELEHLELPAYGITYSKKGHFLKFNFLKQTPKLINVVKAEKKTIKQLVVTHNIHGIISDNRLGAYFNGLPCVFLTHQLQVLSGNTTWISTKLHQKIIEKFDVCWVPDNQGIPNLSGKLGHVNIKNTEVKYLGPLSRFSKKDCEIKFDIMVLLSGPEPQRSLLEIKLFKELETFSGSMLFVRGVVEDEISIETKNNITIYNFMTSDMLETSLNESELIISRSGYTTIMDLAKLGKKAFFIPTPGQFEQEYLADRFEALGLVPFCNQRDFNLSKLDKISEYKGLSDFESSINYKKLFSLFETK